MSIPTWRKTHDPDYVLEALKLSADNVSELCRYREWIERYTPKEFRDRESSRA